MREPSGAGAALMVPVVGDLLLVAQAVLAWAAFRWIGPSADESERAMVAAAVGVAGWWLRFSWIEAGFQRWVTRQVGPRPSTGSQAPLSVRLAWSYFDRFPRGGRKLLWIFWVVGPIVFGSKPR